ncbi:MAG: glycosyl transferase family 2 [Flavobacteriaceae bacterium]|nr:MAG: glycosyl transferase family 2 [Flavobacteriaceae bacterium]
MEKGKPSIKFCIIVPVYNEAKHLSRMLDSLLSQSVKPFQIILVDDGSTDGSDQIIARYCKENSFISSIHTQDFSGHLPGEKIVRAFYLGKTLANSSYDVLCKFDADLFFPENYLETLQEAFVSDPKLGMASGLVFVNKQENWVFENIADKNHVRGPVKAYRKACFDDIGGIRETIGWDTVDVLLSHYYNWKVKTFESLPVRQYKFTGQNYTVSRAKKAGIGFYKMRYGFVLSLLSSLKLAYNQKSIVYFFQCISAFVRAFFSGESYAVNAKEGVFIRKYRYKHLQKNLVQKFKTNTGI